MGTKMDTKTHWKLISFEFVCFIHQVASCGLPPTSRCVSCRKRSPDSLPGNISGRHLELRISAWDAQPVRNVRGTRGKPGQRDTARSLSRFSLDLNIPIRSKSNLYQRNYQRYYQRIFYKHISASGLLIAQRQAQSWRLNKNEVKFSTGSSNHER